MPTRTEREVLLIDDRKVAISNPRKVLFPGPGHTKLDLVRYYLAVAEGALSEERLESFRALERELRYLAIRRDESAQRAQKQKWRAIHREMRRSGRHRRT